MIIHVSKGRKKNSSVTQTKLTKVPERKFWFFFAQASIYLYIITIFPKKKMFPIFHTFL